MSTTAVVTPYVPSPDEKFLHELVVREERALAKHREECRKKRLKVDKVGLGGENRAKLSKSSSLTLNTGSVDLVRQAALKLGYKPVSLSGTKDVLLRHVDGSALRLASNRGKVVLIDSRSDRTAVTSVAREFTAQCVADYAANTRGMKVTCMRLGDEVRVEARDPKQSTLVTVDVRADGIAVIDVEGMKGQGCQEVITGITRSFDGSQIDAARKAQYFVQDEERGKIRV